MNYFDLIGISRRLLLCSGTGKLISSTPFLN
jgi:hypothetical protein